MQHAAITQAVNPRATRLTEHPGLEVCGNSYRGISVNNCIEEAPEVAERLGVSERTLYRKLHEIRSHSL